MQDVQGSVILPTYGRQISPIQDVMKIPVLVFEANKYDFSNLPSRTQLV